MLRKWLIVLMLFPVFIFAQSVKTIQVGSFNVEWFPCKDDGNMMKKYGINLRQPPNGDSTDIPALFQVIKNLDVELLGVVEVVDTDLFQASAQKYLGSQYKYIYAPSVSSQKVGFLYDSSVLELIGSPQIYGEVALYPDSWLRPAFRAYFKAKPDGMDFNAVIVHLKAAPGGWKKRLKQWKALKRILEQVPQQTGDKDIVLMGDFNNVSKLGYNEFKPLMEKLHFLWATSELVKKHEFSNFWQPDHMQPRIQGSLIDQIFISRHAEDEFVSNSVEVGGMCAQKKDSYEGAAIPEYYEKISDHCPVIATFRVDKDDD